MVCDKCKFASCFACKVPWHENQTCAQYQFLQTDGESEEYIKKYCKKCPRSGCGAPAKKIKACHEIHCENSKSHIVSPYMSMLLIGGHYQSAAKLCGVGSAKPSSTTTCYTPSSIYHSISHHCTAGTVRASRRLLGFRSISNPASSDGRYRTGWDQDVGFVGTGEEY